MTAKLQTEQHLEFLSLKGGYIGSSESMHVKMPHCWKSHVAAQIYFSVYIETLELTLLDSKLEIDLLMLSIMITFKTPN